MNGIIVLLKTPPKYRKLDQSKNKNAPKIARLLTIFVEHGIMIHNDDGLGNENSRIALSNDTVFNNMNYIFPQRFCVETAIKFDELSHLIQL